MMIGSSFVRMLRYTLRLLGRYSDHLLLTGLLVTGGLLLAVAFMLETVRGADVWTGFLGVFAILSIVMSAIGYAILFLAKGVLLYQKRSGIP